jgi:hypothetical protein
MSAVLFLESGELLALWGEGAEYASVIGHLGRSPGQFGEG